jgi:hypothetical protein
MSLRDPVPTLLLTGTVGSGKTVVAADIGVLLEERRLPVAIIDLDWLGWVHLASGFDAVEALIAANLAAIWPNFQAAGVRHLVLTRAVTKQESLESLRDALPDAAFTVARLTSTGGIIRDRLRRRDTGAVLDQHLEESTSMARAMDAAAIEDFQVQNEGRPVRVVAGEIVTRLGWVEVFSRRRRSRTAG